MSNYRTDPAEACVRQEEDFDLKESQGQMVKHPARVCQFGCEYECTLVGHAYESIRFLNQCLDHGIVKSAVEEDPRYVDLLVEIVRLKENLLKRLGT